MHLSKNLSTPVILAVLAVVAQASPVNLEKREIAYGCPHTCIRCIYYYHTTFGLQDNCVGDS